MLTRYYSFITCDCYIQAGEDVANFSVANTGKTKFSIALDPARVSAAVDKDKNNGTTRNTVETAASVAGGWTGVVAGKLVI